MSSDQPYSSINAEKFVVRLPKGMRKRIADVAKHHHRSMNSEIVSWLEGTLVESERELNISAGGGKEVQEGRQQSEITAPLLPAEARLVSLYRRLTTERQQALLRLLG